MQVRRVQKYVETLDVLKIKNSVTTSNVNPITKDQSSAAQQHQRHSNKQASSPVQHEKPVKTKQQELSKNSTSGSVVITTQWETFDSMPAPLLDHFSSPTTTPSTHAAAVQPRLSWDLL